MALAVFSGMCPSCGGNVTSEDLVKVGMCPNCVGRPSGRLAEKIRVQRSVAEFSKIFREIAGADMLSIQRAWTIRAVRGESFALLAPTGMGKTTWGLAYCAFSALNGRRAYMIFPTKTLVEQSFSRLRKVLGDKVLAFTGNMNRGKKAEFWERIKSGEPLVLITSSQFLVRHSQELPTFDVIFVDDVDSLFKGSTQVWRVLKIAGFTEEDITLAKEYNITRRKAIAGKGSWDEVNRLQAELENRVKGRGQLFLSSATGRPQRNIGLEVLQVLLGFEFGGGQGALRNLEEFFIRVTEEERERAFLELVKLLRERVLVFGTSAEEAERLAKILRENGIVAEVALSGEQEVIGKFAEGELDVLVGVAAPYGVIVRGLDLPERVAGVVFYRAPVRRIGLGDVSTVGKLMLVSSLLERVWPELGAPLEDIRKVWLRFSQGARDILKKKEVDALEEGFLKRTLTEVRDYIVENLEKPEKVRAIEAFPRWVFNRETKEVVFADANLYIQASGRASRLQAEGLLKGMSVVLCEDERIIKSLQEGLLRRLGEVKIRQATVEEIGEAWKKVLKEREERKGKFARWQTGLLLVESPHKAQTIASFFGRPVKRKRGKVTIYEVLGDRWILYITASQGHVVDLVRSAGEDGIIVDGQIVPVYSSIKRCPKTGAQWVEAPIEEVKARCGLDESAPDDALKSLVVDKADILRDLSYIAEEVDCILLGTDPDTEGEKIAWDLMVLLAPFQKNYLRLEFHEVTPWAIRRALEEAGKISEQLVEAQMVRRIEDRWIGFTLSADLMAKFREELGARVLSAGRVQTPVLKWVINRAREFKETQHFHFRFCAGPITAEVEKNEEGSFITKKRDARKFFEKWKKIEVVGVEEEEREIKPLPPFDTQTMITDAGRILGFSPQETMRIAQALFESGFITYHRTDSRRVSAAGFKVAEDYIKNELGLEDFKATQWGTGGAHECIRPTKPIPPGDFLSAIAEELPYVTPSEHRRLYMLYRLIWNRFMASQMKPVKVRFLRIEAELVGEEGERLKVSLEGISEREMENVRERAFLRFWVPEGIKVLPEVRPRDSFDIDFERSTFWKSSRVPLFTAATLVAEMRKRGIGRPSTYAQIVDKLLKRGYVIPVGKRDFLVPTSVGEKVAEYLFANYSDLVSESRTRELEEKMKAVEEGKRDWQEVLREIWEEVHPIRERLGVEAKLVLMKIFEGEEEEVAGRSVPGGHTEVSDIQVESPPAG